MNKPKFYVVVSALIFVAVMLNWAIHIKLSYRLIMGEGFKGYEGNNTVVSLLNGEKIFTVTGDNPGVRSPILAWPIGISIGNYETMTITAKVIVRNNFGDIIDGGLTYGEVWIKNEAGRWNTTGWNNRFEFNEPVVKDGDLHTYYVYLSGIDPELIMLRFSIELTGGPAPGTTETWFIRAVRFE